MTDGSPKVIALRATDISHSQIRRAVEWCAGQHVTQFVDAGTEIPTEPNVFQLARKIQTDTRWVRVDNDPVVLLRGLALLKNMPTVPGDVRDPPQIIE
jgi:hypothetical protein